jgi:hypothetical protein
MSNWSPDPRQIIVKSDGGSGNMGDVDSEITSPRFGRDMVRGPWVLAWARCHFAGSGSGTANVQIQVDSRLGEPFDTVLHTVPLRGISADMFYRTERDEYEKWTFQPGDEITFIWVNPDSDNITWGLEVGMAYG